MCLSIKVRAPERVLAEGLAEGFEWIVTHNTAGYRCGYVKVEKGHPWYGQEPCASVHGGITFGEADVPCGKGADDGWWVGFDCAHYCDAPDPSLPINEGLQRICKNNSFIAPIVRTQDFVEDECRSLCAQAAAAHC
jgi:hypothetical protein